MRLSIQIELLRTCHNRAIMPDSLIQQLAEQIKAKEESAALSAKIQIHKAEFIQANCGTFFNQVTAELRQLTADLGNALSGSSSAEWPIALSQIGTTGLSIRKEDFPVVYVGLNLTVVALALECDISCAAHKGAPTRAAKSHWKFDVSPENNLILTNSPGSPVCHFSTPKEVAEYVMKTAFTVA